ncbi:MAG TPA: carboxymuconolactone decarboxylase family protein [Saprospiraceae bacterium]|nr:carboxymuconolactone decarboxylase family protein [Saprospiraceae bacterium]
MKKVSNRIIRGMIFMIPFLFVAISVSAQDAAYTKAVKEIEQEFGTVPEMFKVFPDYALAGAWENFKQMSGPNSLIPAKYRELLQLAVAAQIPCQYCIYFHTAAAKANGATDEEIQEAIAQGAQTRHWSMILQGNQVSFEAFKKEFDGMMKYMADKAAKSKSK